LLRPLPRPPSNELADADFFSFRRAALFTPAFSPATDASRQATGFLSSLLRFSRQAAADYASILSQTAMPRRHEVFAAASFFIDVSSWWLR